MQANTLYNELKLKEFGKPPIDVDFGDVERYIPWRMQCKLRMDGIVAKATFSHVQNNFQLRVLGWHALDKDNTNIQCPIGKFTCSSCLGGSHINPVSKKFAYVVNNKGLVCGGCASRSKDETIIPLSIYMAK